ncbi:hypothetical protein BJ742DRAFT_773429 [Cladochytrium replicatum]|nr:hypothetical protein BJ742DRAFT_773429 [Cladochytrium replicatum]
MNLPSTVFLTNLAADTCDHRNDVPSATQDHSSCAYATPMDCVNHTMPFSDARHPHVDLSALLSCEGTSHGSTLAGGAVASEASKISQEIQIGETTAVYYTPPDSSLTQLSDKFAHASASGHFNDVFGDASIADQRPVAAVSPENLIGNLIQLVRSYPSGLSLSILDAARYFWSFSSPSIFGNERVELLGGLLFAPMETILNRRIFSHTATPDVLNATLFPQQLEESLGNQIPLAELDVNTLETFNEIIPGLLVLPTGDNIQDLSEYGVPAEDLGFGKVVRHVEALQEPEEGARSGYGDGLYGMDDGPVGDHQKVIDFVDGSCENWFLGSEAGTADVGICVRSDVPPGSLFPQPSSAVHSGAGPSRSSQFRLTHEGDLSSAISDGVLEMSDNAALVTVEKLGQLLLNARSRRRKRKHRHPCTFTGCVKTFARKYNMHQHRKAHERNRERSHICAVCPATFTSEKGLQRHADKGKHQKKARNPKEFECANPWCIKAYVKHKDLQAHLELCIPDTEEKEKMPVKLVQGALGLMGIKLGNDDRVYFVREQILEFLQRREELKRHGCTVDGCVKRFDRKYNLKSHLQKVHKIEVKEEKEGALADEGEYEGNDEDDDDDDDEDEVDDCVGQFKTDPGK